MKTLLRIDSSIRMTDSISRAMGDYFVSHWKEKYPTGKMIIRDLQETPVPHLTQSTVQAFFNRQSTPIALALSDALINEIHNCNELLITCPMYNFQIPSTMKAYFDHVVRVNKTFQIKNGEYAGLIKNKKCSIMTTMGGRKADINKEEAFESYLRNILAFIGISDTTIYCVDGTSNPEYTTSSLRETKSNILNSIKSL